MSEARTEWYWGCVLDLDPEELTGRHHVRVVFNDGTVIEGRLIYEVDTPWVRVGELRRLQVVDEEAEDGKGETELETPPVIYNADDQNWYVFPDVKSVKLAWDEEEWEQIELHEAVEGDMLVVNGELSPIDEASIVSDPVRPLWWAVEEGSYLVSQGMVSCALRRKEAGSNG